MASRRIGDRVHLVLRFWIPLPAVLETDPLIQDLAAQYGAAVREDRSDDAARLKQAVREAIHTAVKPLDMTSVLPRAEEGV
ncbi:MAG TPA: hypothetical protein VFN94_06000, partial [Nitrospiria bacterium]|nr:hypothetical protein [Nitrospiria bacterium]